MTQIHGKRLALVKLPLTKRAIDALEPKDRAWIAWDDRLTGFGVRVYPSGRKSFIVNYRTGEGGRKAPNKRIVLGRCDRLAPEQARRMAHKALGKVASGDDPAGERAEARAVPLLRHAFEEYMKANPNRTQRADKLYRELAALHMRDWLGRPLDSITRRDVEARFNHLTANSGWSQANAVLSLLRSVYRRPCVDLEGLRNPVDLWIAAGGRFHEKKRRKISSPAEVLPLWRAGIQAVVVSEASRDAFWIGFVTGMRLNEVLALRWERVDMKRLVFRVEETKTGVPLELPITRQLAKVFERRWAGSGALPDEGWVFPSDRSAAGRLEGLAQHYRRIGEACGTRFWYHGLRNAFITVAERELMLPPSLTKRLVNHARPSGRHRALCRRVDHRAAAPARSENRRPHPGVDDGRRRDRDGGRLTRPPLRRPGGLRSPARLRFALRGAAVNGPRAASSAGRSRPASPSGPSQWAASRRRASSTGGCFGPDRSSHRRPP